MRLAPIALGLALFAAQPVIAATLEEPAAITAPAGLSQEDVLKAVRVGGAKSGWAVEPQAPGLAFATLRVRTHTARVNVKYDAKSVAITYLDSTNLKFEQDGGERSIHANYNKWVQTLATDIQENLGRADLKAMDATVAASTGAGMNAPPARPLKEYRSFELLPVTIANEYADSNEKAMAKIQENMNTMVAPTLQAWTAAQTKAPRNKLVLQPHVEQIKFIGGAARFWVGAMAGSSYLTMRLTMKDADTGEVVGEATFKSNANAFAGAGTMGGADNQMLNAVPAAIQRYVNNNYQAAVPTMVSN